MRYKGKVYRPPSEAYSLIVQVTYGCSHNRCAFCDMYDDKHFSMRPMQEIREDFELARRVYHRVERVFLADGDALMRKTDELIEILGLIYGLFPECERVTCYASPTSLQIKSEDDLRLLRARGLRMVYMGLESGCDAVLTRMNKGHDAAAIVAAGQKARRCGLALSVTAISGLGSRELLREHAIGTAQALSAMNPEYVGLLTLMVEPGTPLAKWVREGSFEVLGPVDILRETELFLQHIDSPGSVFRMNHASNYLTLKGTQLARNLAIDFTSALEMLIHRSDLLERTLLASLVLGNASGLFDQRAALLGTALQDGIKLALADDGVSIFAQSRIVEDILNVHESAGTRIDQILRLARTVHTPRDSNLVKVNRKHMVGIIQNKRNLSHTNGLARR